VERRNFLKLGAAFAAMPIAGRSAIALDYPTRPVQVIVGQAAASSSDITARLISQFLSQHLGQQFVVEVRPGATGNIATEQVVRAAPDGYTLLLVNSQNTINAALFPNLPFDFVRDRRGISRSACDGSVAEFSGADRAGVHRLCQSQSG
jgi:tripartite-type tricarboxylate transporter receptor subunit TctC